MEARLSGPTDLAGFRAEARQLLALQVPPEEVHWSAPSESPTILADEATSPPPGARAASAIVPASFVRLCELVVQHRDPERFALLYRLLWRLVHEPGLRHDAADHDMARAQHMAHAVRRDIHKLKTHLRFRTIDDADFPGDPLQLAWCEPAHFVVETVGAWFTRSSAERRWTLLTPERSLYWDRSRLHCGPGLQQHPAAGAPAEVWLDCWRRLFAAGAAR